MCIRGLARWRRHKRTAIVLAIAAGIVVVVVVVVGALSFRGDSRAKYLTAVTARESAERLLDSKQIAEADRRCRDAIEILMELARRSKDPRFRFEQAVALETRARIQLAADQPEEGDHLYLQALNVWSRLLGEDAKAVEVRWRLARCFTLWAPLLTSAGRWDEAERALERASTVCRTAILNVPGDARIDRQLEEIQDQLGLLYLDTGRYDRAIAYFDGAVRSQKKLVESPTSTALDRDLLIFRMTHLGKAYCGAEQRVAGLREFREARELAERQWSESPSNQSYAKRIATLLETEATELEGDSGRAKEARSRLERAVVIRESLVTGPDPDADCLDRLAQDCRALADSFLDERSQEQAEECQRKEVWYRSRLAEEHPDVSSFRSGHGEALHNLAEMLRQRGAMAEALSLELKAAPLLAEVYRENVLDADRRRSVSCAYWTLCTLELEGKDHRAAARDAAFYQSIESDGFEEAHEAAGFLCRCVVLCQGDPELEAAEKEQLALSYANRAIDALRAAVRRGFRDLDELRSSSVYEPLRRREDFSRIAREVAAIDAALKEG